MNDIQNQQLPLWAQILLHQPPDAPAPASAPPVPSKHDDENIPAA